MYTSDIKPVEFHVTCILSHDSSCRMCPAGTHNIRILAHTDVMQLSATDLQTASKSLQQILVQNLHTSFTVKPMTTFREVTHRQTDRQTQPHTGLFVSPWNISKIHNKYTTQRIMVVLTLIEKLSKLFLRTSKVLNVPTFGNMADIFAIVHLVPHACQHITVDQSHSIGVS